jgi:hypothetical protein
MRRYLVIILVFCTSLLAQEERIRVRFLDGSVKEAYVIKADAAGVDLKLLPEDITARFRWEELSPESARSIKSSYLDVKPRPEVPKPERPEGLTVKGVRIITKDGRVLEGIIRQELSTPQQLFLKNARWSKLIKRSDVEKIMEVELALTDVYTPQEVYVILSGRIVPRDAQGYERLAEELVRIGLPERSHTAFKIAQILRDPSMPEHRLYRDLERLRAEVKEVSLKESIYHLQELSLLGRYEQILEGLDKVEEKLPNLKELKRIRSYVSNLRQLSLEEQIISEWYRVAEALILQKAVDRNLGFDPATTFVKEEIQKEVVKRVGGRFNIGSDDPTLKLIWSKRPTSTQHKISYDGATWLVEKPGLVALKQEWWSKASNTLRYKYLKGLYVENYMEAIKVFHKNCSTCGGQGIVDRKDYPESLDGICPGCKGLKKHRVVFYR